MPSNWAYIPLTGDLKNDIIAYKKNIKKKMKKKKKKIYKKKKFFFFFFFTIYIYIFMKNSQYNLYC